MNFFFTFGQAHVTTEGVRMKDYWVTVEADDFDDARDKFVQEFSSVYMPSPDKWSFQYDESNFSPEFYPRGEYMKLG